MKSEELMVGDFVKYTDKYPYEELRGMVVRVERVGGRMSVRDMESGKFHDSEHPAYFEGIPLTPEILKKNGFTDYGESWYIPNTKDCVMVGFHMYETTINISKDRVSFCKSTPCSYRSCSANRGVFVHELQHAIRLCGINKDFNP